MMAKKCKRWRYPDMPAAADMMEGCTKPIVKEIFNRFGFRAFKKFLLGIDVVAFVFF